MRIASGVVFVIGVANLVFGVLDHSAINLVIGAIDVVLAALVAWAADS